jgi:hypothetical protein
VKSQRIEMLLRDLLRITTREPHRLSEILADNFDFFDEQIVKILSEEYLKSKNDWKVICGCFSVIWKASQKYPRLGSKTFRNSYPLINKGLQDRRVSVKRLAALSVLNIICRIYWEARLHSIHINEDNDKEISAEIIELRKKIRSADFLESFNLMFPSKLEKRIWCESAGIKTESLVDVSKSMLG